MNKILLCLLMLVSCSQKPVPPPPPVDSNKFAPFRQEWKPFGFVIVDQFEVLDMMDEGELFVNGYTTEILIGVNGKYHLIKINDLNRGNNWNRQAVNLLTDISRGEALAVDIAYKHEDTSTYAPDFRAAVRNYEYNKQFKRERLTLLVNPEEWDQYEWHDFYFNITTDKEYAAEQAEAKYRSTINYVLTEWKNSFVKGGWKPVGDSSVFLYYHGDTLATLIAYKNLTFKEYLNVSTNDTVKLKNGNYNFIRFN